MGDDVVGKPLCLDRASRLSIFIIECIGEEEDGGWSSTFSFSFYGKLSNRLNVVSRCPSTPMSYCAPFLGWCMFLGSLKLQSSQTTSDTFSFIFVILVIGNVVYILFSFDPTPSGSQHPSLKNFPFKPCVLHPLPPWHPTHAHPSQSFIIFYAFSQYLSTLWDVLLLLTYSPSLLDNAF